MLVKRIVQIIDRHTLIFQKLKAIIVVDIILRVHTVYRYWIIILFQLPYDRCYMVYVVKVPCEKQVHNLPPSYGGRRSHDVSQSRISYLYCMVWHPNIGMRVMGYPLINAVLANDLYQVREIPSG